MSVVSVDSVPVKKPVGKVAREILNEDIRAIIKERIKLCRLENFPFAVNNTQNVRYHINRSIHEVTMAIVHDFTFNTKAFNVYIDKNDDGNAVPYIRFDPDKWDQETKEYILKGSVSNGSQHIPG